MNRGDFLYNAYYINELAKKSKNDKYSCWRLGEILHELTMRGYDIIQNVDTGLIEIKKKDVIQ